MYLFLPILKLASYPFDERLVAIIRRLAKVIHSLLLQFTRFVTFCLILINCLFAVLFFFQTKTWSPFLTSVQVLKKTGVSSAFPQHRSFMILARRRILCSKEFAKRWYMN